MVQHKSAFTLISLFQEIRKKIMSLGFNNCHACIWQVATQSSVGGSVVIQVRIEVVVDLSV